MKSINLTDEKDYRAYPALSASDFKMLSDSYGHWKHRQEYPEDYKYTAALRYGTIVHACVLEPERFDAEFVVPPEINKRTKAGKEEWAEWEKENGSKFAVSQEELEKAWIIRDHTFKNPRAKELLTGGQAEVPKVWKEKIDGIEHTFKARADYLKQIDDVFIVVDLKTAQSASFEEFQRSIVKWKYSIQAYHYRKGFSPEGVKAHFMWVVVEKMPPYGCAIYAATDQIYAQGKHFREVGLSNYMRGEAGELDGLPYPSEVTPITLPRWATKNDNFTTKRVA